MNTEPDRQRTGFAYATAILGSLLIVVALVWAMRRYAQPTPLGTERATARARALAELRAGETEVLNNVAWINQSNGIVRLKIEDAMKVVEKEWANPAAARSNLIARVEKANPPPSQAGSKPVRIVSIRSND